MEAKLTPTEVADKVFELSEQFNQYVFEHPEILDDLPDKAVLVFLDVEDLEFNEANMKVAATSPLPTESERVYVQMRRHVRVVELVEWEAEIVPPHGLRRENSQDRRQRIEALSRFTLGFQTPDTPAAFLPRPAR
jgi:hypothetical protein